MCRHRNNGRGQGRGQRRGRGAGFGHGRGADVKCERGAGRGRGRTRGAVWQPSDPGSSRNWKRPISEISEHVPTAERKRWLEDVKEHLAQRMQEVDAELRKF